MPVREAALLGTWQAFALVLGLVIGSFLNVCIVRIPEDRSVVTPRSHCPVCGHTVRWYDNIPVVSWVLLRASCRDCGATISARYPLIELLTGLLAWLLFRRLVPGPDALDLGHAATWVVYFGFLCLLVVATYVDVRHRIIPDQTSSWALPVAVGAVAGLGALDVDLLVVPTWRESLVGAISGSGFFALTALVSRRIFGAEALGWGDVKLIGMIGAFLGPIPGVTFVMLAGSMIGSVLGLGAILVVRRRVLMPFAPSLALAAAIYLYYGDIIIPALLPGADP